MDKYTTWHLANMADCASPDRHDGRGFDYEVEPQEGSAGAVFLRRVAHYTAEALEYRADDEREWSDIPAEIADGCVPIYTHDLWATFVDLAAWEEDLNEFGESTRDMTDEARISLYMIAERLAGAIVTAALEDGEMDA